jgi:hypothetical protein
MVEWRAVWDDGVLLVRMDGLCGGGFKKNR